MSQIACNATGGIVYGQSSTYATARDTGATVVANSVQVGQSKAGATYTCFETFLAFDTTGIHVAPANVQLVLPNPSLSLTNPGDTFSVKVAAYDWGATLTTADFRTAAQLTAFTPLGSVAVLSVIPTTLFIPLTPSGITLNGTTRLVVYSSRHAAGTSPTDNEYDAFDAFTGLDTTTDPLLIVGTALDSVLVQVGFNTANPLSRPTWTNVSKDMVSVSTSRGKSGELEQFQTGTAQIVLRNESYDYDPDNTTGPYAGDILPSKPVRISAADSSGVQQDIFTGYVQRLGGWTYGYTAGPDGANTSTATINAVDYFGIAAAQELAAVEPIFPSTEVVPLYPGSHTGELLVSLLGNQLVDPFPGWLVSDGFTITQGYVGGKNALQYVQDLALAEGGATFIQKDGFPVFDDRFAPVITHATSQATFDDSGADVDIRVEGFEKEYATVIYNSSTIQGTNRIPETYSDATSITAYGEADYNLSDLNIDGTEEAYARALYYVKSFKDPISAPSSLRIAPRRGGATLDAALQLELRDRAVVRFMPPGATGPPLGIPLASDTFNRANSTTDIGSTDGTGTIDPTAWTAGLGTWGINTNRAYPVTSTIQAHAYVELGLADVDITVTFAVRDSGHSQGIACRIVDADNLILAISDAANHLSLTKRVGGSGTVLGTGNTVVSGDKIRIIANGDTLSVYRNNVLEIGPITESANNANTKHGLWASTASAARFDDWIATGVGNQVFIRSIGHQLDCFGNWDTQFGFESAERYAFAEGKTYFTLGTSALGSNDILGW